MKSGIFLIPAFLLQHTLSTAGNKKTQIQQTGALFTPGPAMMKSKLLRMDNIGIVVEDLRPLLRSFPGLASALQARRPLRGNGLTAPSGPAECPKAHCYAGRTT